MTVLHVVVPDILPYAGGWHTEEVSVVVLAGRVDVIWLREVETTLVAIVVYWVAMAVE